MPKRIKTITSRDELQEEVEKYDAHSEEKEIKFKQCPHGDNLKYDGSELRCLDCGAAWSGQNISELYEALKSRNL